MADAELLASLWQRMTDLFPNRWLPAVGEFSPDAMAVKTWGAALAGVGVEEVKAGLRALVRTGAEFPPSAPQFRSLCLTDEMIPSEAAAIQEAAHAARAGGMHWDSHAWSHPCVYQAAKHVGTYVLCHYADFALRSLFRDEYRAVCARWRGGARFECPEPKRIAHEKPKRAAPEKAAPHIEEIQRILNVNDMPEEV